MDRKYLKLQSDEGDNSVELSSSHGIGESFPSATNPILINKYELRILYKEKIYEILCLQKSSTVSELKAEICKKTEITPPCQRLIFSGKALKPDDKTLEFFKIENKASIHLFPVPLSSINNTSDAAAIAVDATPIDHPLFQVDGRPFPNGTRHTAAHFDPSISQSSREVKLWSLILLFLSAMTLFNNISYFSSTGKVGTDAFDALVTILDTMCSAAGIYVSQLGLNAANTLELEAAKKYLYRLSTLACCSVVMRLVWVVDVILQVEKAIKSSQQHAADGTSGPGNPSTPSNPIGGGGDDSSQKTGPLPDNMVYTFGIQAGLIALICAFAWISCVQRASNLRNAVQTHAGGANPNNMPVPVQAPWQIV